MRLLVVGAGATGGYFGGRLAQAGRDVTFLVRPARAAALRRDGLRIVSPHGDAAIVPQLVEPGGIAAPFDAVLLTVKAYHLAQAMEDVAPAIGTQTVIVPMLNGMRHLDDLAARFGASAVAGGVCRVAAMVDAEGRIVQLQGFQDLAYGELDGRRTPRMEAFDALVRDAGFAVRLSDSILQEMWEKWMVTATMGAIICLLRGTIGEIAAAPGGAGTALAILDEVVSIVSAVGLPPREPAIARLRAFVTESGSRQTSSLYRDLLAGGRVEADHKLGDLLRRGAGAGVTAPLVAAAYAALCIHQTREAA